MTTLKVKRYQVVDAVTQEVYEQHILESVAEQKAAGYVKKGVPAVVVPTEYI